MYYSVSQATTLYDLSDPTSILGGSPGTPVPAGALVSAATPPQTVAGFTQVTYGNKTGWVSSNLLGTPAGSTDVKLGVGLLAIFGAWWFFFKK